jgi:hypothetical protein
VATQLQELHVGLANDLLAEAKDAAAEARWAEAKLTAEVIVLRHGDQPAAAEARRLVTTARERLKAEQQLRTVTMAELQKALSQAVQFEKQGDALVRGYVIPGSTVKEQRARERAVGHYEKAWLAVRDLQSESDEEGAGAVRLRIRDKLGAQYLALATNFLQRRTLTTAESYNAKACALDPDSGGCRHVQELIIQARITSGWGL